MNIAHKPGGGLRGVPVAKLSEWNFKLIVHFINQADKTSRTIEMNVIRHIRLSEIEIIVLLS